MKRILHVCWGLERTNGAANIARLIIGEQCASGCEAKLVSRPSRQDMAAADELWCHCGWYPAIWLAVFWARRLGKRIVWMPEGCYDPVRLRYHGWKKRLAGPLERRALRCCDVVLATCQAEAEWITAYEPRVRKVSVTDIRRFFGFDAEGCARRMEAMRGRSAQNPIRVLYLGREHPLKGVACLRAAVRKLDGLAVLTEESAADEEGKLRLMRGSDVMVLPTLSDNFGLVVAEALSQGLPVVTTDGAPAWTDISLPYGICLRGFRDGDFEERVELLRKALLDLSK